MSNQSGEKLVLSGIFLLVLFFSLIRVFINGGRYFFPLELAGLLLLSLLTFIAFVGYTRVWGKRLLLLVFLGYISNIILIWLLKGSLYIILLLVAMAGFLIAIPWKHFVSPSPGRTSPSSFPMKAQELHSQVFDPVEKEEEKKEIKAKAAKTTSFSPGKYVASTQSNQFHQPQCDWAKKIRKDRRVWFQSMDDAWEKGFRKHSCLA